MKSVGVSGNRDSEQGPAAVVTGAGGGIGARICRRLAAGYITDSVIDVNGGYRMQ